MNSDINLHVIRGVNGVRYIMPYFIDGIDQVMNFMRGSIYGEMSYHTEYIRKDGRKGRVISSLGRHLESLHGYSQIYTSEYTFSPLITFFFEQYRRHPIQDYFTSIDAYDEFSIELFNDFVRTMRKNAVTDKLKKKVLDWESKSNKNMERLIEFEADIFEGDARLMLIRLDFNYHKATFTSEEVECQIAEAMRRKERDQANYLAGKDISTPQVVEGRIALEEVQKDRKRFIANMKGKPSLFKHLVGYVWRIEYTRQAGYHMHVLLFFDGTEVQKHEYLAQKIGYYYQDVISEGRSYFENCNTKKSRYGDDWALGQIDHWDGVKRAKLRKAMQYFCKKNQLVQVIPYEGCHLFGCQLAHRKRKGRAGRPRTKGIVAADHQHLRC